MTVFGYTAKRNFRSGNQLRGLDRFLSTPPKWTSLEWLNEYVIGQIKSRTKSVRTPYVPPELGDRVMVRVKFDRNTTIPIYGILVSKDNWAFFNTKNEVVHQHALRGFPEDFHAYVVSLNIQDIPSGRPHD